MLYRNRTDRLTRIRHPYRDLPAGLFDKLANAKLSTSETGHFQGVLDVLHDLV